VKITQSLERLGKMLVASPHDAYSVWCWVAGKPVSLRAAQKIIG
jgi:hypothetical protein